MLHIDRSQFSRFYESEMLPEWTCPQCNKGKLIAKEGSMKTYEYKESLSQRDDNNWEPYWVTGSFLGKLTCNSEKCKGSTIVAGEMFVEHSENYDPVDGPAWTEHFKPKYFDPPLKVLHLNFTLPAKVNECLEESFKLIWSDEAACANKMRIVVESIMDHHRLKKWTTDKKGKRVPIALHHRITEFKKKHQDVGDLLEAIKWIGNGGSHELNALSREDILEAYEFLYLALEKLYSSQVEKLLKRAKQINRYGGIRRKKK